MEFITIPKSEFDLLTTAKDSWLTHDEWATIMEHEKIFTKYLEKAKFNYQLLLAKWKGIERPDQIIAIYNKIEAMSDLIKGLKAFEESMIKFKQEQEEKLKREKEEKKDH